MNVTERASDREAPADAEAIAAMSVPELIAYIERRHHTFTISELKRAEGLMREVLAAHGREHAYLKELSEVLEELAQELAVHMQKEERMLFPYLATLAEAVAHEHALARPPFHSALNPIRVMHEEHDAVDIYLQRLRELASDYTPPPDACGTFRALYGSLAALDRDLREHVHLENDVLFPRAAPLEQQAFRR